MASQYFRLLDAMDLVASMTQPRDQVFDAGPYSKLELQFRVVRAGGAGTLQLQHAAVNEESAYIALGAPVALNATSNSHVSISNYLRYVRWTTNAAVAGSPAALIDVLAKE